MAHFAELDQQNTVKRVIVISNADIVTSDGNESEYLGIQLCKELCGVNTRWVQTSYNANFRRKYAGIGDVYDQELDVFYPGIGPFPSWVLDEEKNWQSPIPMPDDGKIYFWQEENLNWREVEQPSPQPE